MYNMSNLNVAITRAEILNSGGMKIFQEDKSDILINYMNALGLAHLIAGGKISCSQLSTEQMLK